MIIIKKSKYNEIYGVNKDNLFELQKQIVELFLKNIDININPKEKIDFLICEHEKCKGHIPNFVFTGLFDLKLNCTWQKCCNRWVYRVKIFLINACSVCGIKNKSKYNFLHHSCFYCSCCKRLIIN